MVLRVCLLKNSSWRASRILGVESEVMWCGGMGMVNGGEGKRRSLRSPEGRSGEVCGALRYCGGRACLEPRSVLRFGFTCAGASVGRETLGTESSCATSDKRGVRAKAG